MSELSAAFAQKSRIAEWTLGIFCCVMAVYNLFFSTPYYVFLSMLGLVLVFLILSSMKARKLFSI